MPYSDKLPPTFYQVVCAGGVAGEVHVDLPRAVAPEHEIAGKGERANRAVGGGCARGDNCVGCVLSRAADSAGAAQGGSYGAGGDGGYSYGAPASEPFTIKVPSLRFVVPLNVFVAFRITVPGPFFVKVAELVPPTAC